MGGLGSGMWERDDWGKKPSVEQCYTLDANEMARNGVFRVERAGSYSWNDQYGEPLFSVEFSTSLYNGNSWNGSPVLVLSYRLPEAVCIPVFLQRTRPHFGGWRWWFTCSLIVGGVPCNRRVGKLYLPPGSLYFGCRHCHGLVYRREPDPLEHAQRFLQVAQKRLERAWKKHGWVR
jgi:hypothetical protein